MFDSSNMFVVYQINYCRIFVALTLLVKFEQSLLLIPEYICFRLQKYYFFN